MQYYDRLTAQYLDRQGGSAIFRQTEKQHLMMMRGDIIS